MTTTTRHRLGWALGAVLLGVILFHLSRSPQWKNFEWSKLATLLLNVNPWLLAGAIVLNLATLVIRAVRWRFFVNPIKKCSLWMLFVAQALGFCSIYLVGRAGEIVRPAYIAKSERLPFTSQLAVWTIERVYDGFCLVLLFALALYFEPARSASPANASLLIKMHHAALGILAFCVVAIACLVAYLFWTQKILLKLQSSFTRLPASLRRHFLSFLQSFSSGLYALRNPGDFSASIASSVILWMVSVTSLWLMLLSLGGRLSGFGWWAAAITAFFAAVGLAVQLPGIGGGYQVAVLLALKDVFHVPAEAAAGAAILTWATVMAPCLLLGLILVASGGLSFNKLKQMVEEEESEAKASDSVPAASRFLSNKNRWPH